MTDTLPSISDTDWEAYQAARWQRETDLRIGTLGDDLWQREADQRIASLPRLFAPPVAPAVEDVPEDVQRRRDAEAYRPVTGQTAAPPTVQPAVPTDDFGAFADAKIGSLSSFLPAGDTTDLSSTSTPLPAMRQPEPAPSWGQRAIGALNATSDRLVSGLNSAADAKTAEINSVARQQVQRPYEPQAQALQSVQDTLPDPSEVQSAAVGGLNAADTGLAQWANEAGDAAQRPGTGLEYVTRPVRPYAEAIQSQVAQPVVDALRAGNERRAAGDDTGAAAGYAGALGQAFTGAFNAPGELIEAGERAAGRGATAEIAGALTNFATPWGGAQTLSVLGKMGEVGQRAILSLGVAGGFAGGKLAYDQAKAAGKSDTEAWLAGAAGAINGADMALGAGELARGVGVAGQRALPAIREGAERVGQRWQDVAEQMPDARVGVVPVDVARSLLGEVRLPDARTQQEVASQVPGVRFDQDGMELDVSRWQQPQIAGQDASLRGGVFYTAGAPTDSRYRTNGGYALGATGGPQSIAGRTRFRAPLLVDGNTEKFLGATADDMRRAADDALAALEDGEGSPSAFGEATNILADALESARVPDPDATAARILNAAQDNEQLANGLVENALASYARTLGYDAVVVTDLGNRRGIVEVFDLREATYPTPDGGYTLRPEFQPRPQGQPSPGADASGIVQGGRSGDTSAVAGTGDATQQFPHAGERVGGLVVRPDVPDLPSIGATFEPGTYRVLPGVREVPMAAFRDISPPYAARDAARARELAQQIDASREINPLIIAVDAEGPYILEGSRRIHALQQMGVESFPAVVVLESTAKTASDAATPARAASTPPQQSAYVVRNTRSGNASQAFATRAEAEGYANRLPASVRPNVEIVERNALSGREGGIIQGTDGGTGSRLAESARAATSPFMARGAVTTAEKLTDTTGAALGAAAGATADDDATPGERVAGGVVGGLLGGLGGAQGRALVRRGGQLIEGMRGAGDTLGVAAHSLDEDWARSAKMLEDGFTPPDPDASAVGKLVRSKREALYRAWVDPSGTVRRIQEDAAKAAGRPLTTGERIETLYRAWMGRADAARVKVEEGLREPLRELNLSDKEYDALRQYLLHADDADKSAAIGKRVEAEELDKPLPRVVGERAVPRIAAMANQRRQAVDEAVKRLALAKDALASASDELRAGAPRTDLAGNPLPLDAVTKETARLKAAVAKAKQRVHEAEVAHRRTERLAESGRQRLASAWGSATVRRAEVERARTEGAATKGAEAAAGRAFSGDVRAHPVEDWDAWLDTTYGPESAGKVKQAAQAVWDFNAGRREEMRAEGLISDELNDYLRTNFPHYDPTVILSKLPSETETAQPIVKVGSPLMSVADAGVKRLSIQGTTEARLDPIAAAVEYAFRTEGVIRRNRVAQAILALRDEVPELRALIREVVPKTATDPDTGIRGQILASAEEAHKGKLKPNETYLHVYQNGERVDLIADKAVAPLFQLGDPAAQAAMELARWIGRATGVPILRAAAVQYNPAYPVVEAIRSGWNFLMHQKPQQLPRATYELGRAYTDLTRRTVGDAFGRNARIPDLNEMLKAGGGSSSGYYGVSAQQLAERYVRDPRGGQGIVRPVRSAADMAGAVVDLLTAVPRGVNAAREVVGNAPKLAEYRMVKRAGGSVDDAMMAARNMNLDADRAGQWARVVNQMLPFFSIALQGGAKLAGELRMRPAQTSMMLAGGVLAPSLLAEAWNRSMYPDDADDIPWYLRDTGITLLTPWKQADKADGTRGQRLYLWLPMPQEYSLIKTLHNYAVDQTLGTKGRTWDDVLTAGLRSMSPVAAITDVAPPLLEIAYGIRSNYDFFRDRPIVPDRLDDLPAARQFRDETPALARLAGAATGKSPLHLEYAARNAAPGLANAVFPATDEAARAAGMDAPPAQAVRGPADVPILGGMVKSVLRSQGGQKDQDALKELDRRRATVRDQRLADLRKRGAYRNATPAQQAEQERRMATAINADFAKAKRDLLAQQEAARKGRAD